MSSSAPVGSWSGWLDRRTFRVVFGTVFGCLLLLRVAEIVAAQAGEVWGFDFAAYWTAAGRVFAGGSPYAPAINQAGSFLAYLYPPPLAVALAPLAGLGADYRAAEWPWLLIRAFVAVATLVVLLRYSGMQRRREVAMVTVVVMALPAVTWDLIMGNVNLLLLALLAGAWLSLRSDTARAESVAGALVGVAAVIKVFPGLLIVWLLLTRRFRGALVCVVVIVGIALATLPVVGVAGWVDYLRVATDLTGSGPPTAFTFAWPIIVLGGFAATVWSARQQPTWVSFSVCILAAMLLSPTLVATYLALAVLALILLLVYSGNQSLVIFCYAVIFVAGMLQFEAPGPMDMLLARELTTLTIATVVGALLWAGHQLGRRPV